MERDKNKGYLTQCNEALAPSRSNAPRAQIINLSVLPVNARPIPFASLDFEEVPKTRQLECPGYHRCLEFVASIRWQGFSCRRCPLNEPSAWEEDNKDPTDDSETTASIIRFSRG
ncbi:MAG: hypothetical protein VYC39_04330 [Myxococcota bacterium]|nr:hypothetical protein [Myxococcota bacterium]